jgi:hypothetical protein
LKESMAKKSSKVKSLADKNPESHPKPLKSKKRDGGINLSIVVAMVAILVGLVSLYNYDNASSHRCISSRRGSSAT